MMDKIKEINKTTICLVQNTEKLKGILFGQHPLTYPTPVLLSQITVCSLGTAIFVYFLTPLGESNFVSQVIVGVLLGPSVLGRIELVNLHVFSRQSFIVAYPFAYFGLMLFLFLVGVKTDLSILRKPGNKGMVIGFSVFLMPLLLNVFVATTLQQTMDMNQSLRTSLCWVASFQSISNFHVIICFLGDINLFNTEIGRLAVSSSMISGMCSWVCVVVLFTFKESVKGKWSEILTFMSVFISSLVLLIVYVLRPILLWMVRRQIHERTMKEGYVIWVFVMIMGCALYADIIGQHYMFGPTILGMAIPSGPPLGSTLVTTLESFVSYLMMPLYIAINTAGIDFYTINASTVCIVGILEFSGLIWKVMATMMPCIYYRMSIRDALHLGLIMSNRGIVDVIFLMRAMKLGLINRETFSIMLIFAIIFTAITSPMVKFMYRPSQRFANFKRTIQHARPHGELRILACLHHQEHTPSIINLIEATNPSPRSPICLYVIHFIELIGRAAPIFKAYPRGKTTSSQSNQSDCIINAFRLYENQAEGIMVYPFTSISPYEAMHDEVCGFALEKKASLLIIPFHKLMSVHASEVSTNAIRTVNLNILKKAPCSVGILVDRGSMKGNIHISGRRNVYKIGVVFLGGQDDREALAYGSRMAKHPNVALTVVHFIDPHSHTNEDEIEEVDQDFEMMATFKQDKMHSKNCVYEEEHVKDSVELVNGIIKVENSFDLMLVGRRHSVRTTLLEGLTDWNEYPELGVIGDMLASSDSYCKVSVLVMQQQCFQDTPNQFNSTSAVKVWPIQ